MTAEDKKTQAGKGKSWMLYGAIVVVLLAVAGYWWQSNANQPSPEAKAYIDLLDRTRPKLLKFIQKNPLPKPTEEQLPMPDDLPEILKEPMRNSLKWFFENPVPIEDTKMSSILELSEEILLTYQMYRKSSGKAREFMREYVFASIAIIAENYDLLGANSQAINDPFTFSSILTIANAMGYPDDEFDPIFIARSQMLSNRDTYEGPFRAALLWALYDLGLVKKSGIRKYWKQSISHYELQSHWLSNKLNGDNVDEAEVINAFYAITHEILPFTGLGKHDIPLIKKEQTNVLQQLMVDAIAYLLTIDRKSTDIMCELVVCANALHAGENEKHNQVLLDSYIYLANKEKESESISGKGTFGIDTRMEEMNRMTAMIRHPVYTGLWAMLSAAQDSPEETA